MGESFLCESVEFDSVICSKTESCGRVCWEQDGRADGSFWKNILNGVVLLLAHLYYKASLGLQVSKYDNN